MPHVHHVTSESVSMGHPDKVADQIADAILDSLLAVDPDSRVACEVLVTTNRVVVAGEVTSSAIQIDAGGALDADSRKAMEEVVRKTIKGIGYDDPATGFDGSSCKIHIWLDPQSTDIALGVDKGGAGDQGFMYGYATDETSEYMPLSIALSHRLVALQAKVRRSGTIPQLRPDAKSQVSIQYKDGQREDITSIVLSTQHGPMWKDDYDGLTDAVREHIIKPALAEFPEIKQTSEIEIQVNPTGNFEIGGPLADCGLTGRKIIVDTYGGHCQHGGGSFSGKDPSKVDRSGAYMARHVAKNLVAAGLARSCRVQLSYIIGSTEPSTLRITCDGTATIPESKLEERVRDKFDLTPKGIIETLQLRRPIYAPTACHGHFGRLPGEAGEGTFSWELTDKADDLRENNPPFVEATAG